MSAKPETMLVLEGADEYATEAAVIGRDFFEGSRSLLLYVVRFRLDLSELTLGFRMEIRFEVRHLEVAYAISVLVGSEPDEAKKILRFGMAHLDQDDSLVFDI
jgi:hypothetical protein